VSAQVAQSTTRRAESTSVGHQSRSRPAIVHVEYVLPSYTNGNWQPQASASASQSLTSVPHAQ
jgi:hypothetical protein